MKINQENDGESMLYCLSSRRHFKTIVELVSYYERNDLGENFAGYAPKLILNRQYTYAASFAVSISRSSGPSARYMLQRYMITIPKRAAISCSCAQIAKYL